MPESTPLKLVTIGVANRLWFGDERAASSIALQVGVDDGRELAPGWYSLSGRILGTEKAALLTLYAREAGAPVALGPVLLQSDGEVGRHAIYRLPAPAGMLWVADDADESRFDGAVELEIRPIGRRDALLAILKAIAGAGAQWALVALACAVTGRIVRGDLAAAGGVVHSRFCASMRDTQVRSATRHLDRDTLWLRRGSFARRARPVDLIAGGQLEIESRPRKRVWIATGDDPRFVVPAAVLGRTLASGWYRFRLRLRSKEGRIVGPCLYPDYGHGDAEGAVVPLGEPDRHGRIDVLLVLTRPARALRFDPTMVKASFELDEVRLERLNRAAAFTYMLRRIQGAAGRDTLRGKLGALATFFRDLCCNGLSRATTVLYARYLGNNVQARHGYAGWVEHYDTHAAFDLQAFAERAAEIVEGPLISILVPVYETPERWLRRCIQSVLAQAYGNWELCLADDASPSPHVRRVLAEYAARDPRIKVMHRESNGHISAASNSALALCSGDYIGLLDHDDELRPHALLEMAEAIVRNPGLKVLYSDEDKLDEQGRRFDPYFKPDWNPDLMRSQNYLCHFSVIEAALVREVGGFREGYEGSQDHDLLLRCTERLAPAQIHHVPKVLYHWRAIEGSTALVRDAKDYASVAGARAVRDHLARIGADAVVEELPHGHYRVRWGLGAKPPKVSLVIPTRDRLELLRTCVESVLERTRYPDFEILVIDNQSREPETLAYLAGLERDGRARVLRYDAPFNYSAINNWAVSQCDGEIIGLLNNDLEAIAPDWLEEMVSQARRSEIGAVGAMLYYPDERIQHAGVFLGVGGVANHAYVGQPRGYPGHGGRAKVVQNISAVTAACLLVRRSVYREVGGLDESLQVAFNDVDFCLRVREAGYRNLWTPFAELYHHESASRGADDTPEKAARFRTEVERMESRWGEALYRDPAYNPNLTLRGTDFGFAFPPRSVPSPCSNGEGKTPL